jgi:hypothetical protein
MDGMGSSKKNEYLNLLFLNVRTMNGTVRTEDAAISRQRPQLNVAAFALIEELANVEWHDFVFDVATLGTGESRGQD